MGRASSLDAEFEALRNRFGSEKARQQTALESKKQELLTKLQTFKTQLKDKRQAVQAKGDSFELDLRNGLDQIKKAFQRLFE